MKTADYKVVLPSAGLGSRLKNFSKHINKSLVTLGTKPVISHIIEKFPIEVEIVVALGYKKESVREFLELMYPSRNITFVEVDKYEGEGSGLGYTLLACKDKLMCPFIFISNDTIVTDDIPAPVDFNWMGYADGKDVEQYRSLRMDENNNVVEICSKGALGDVKPYIGLAGVKDYKEFWKAMEEGIDKGAIEVGESYALKFLIGKTIKALKFEWYDMGNIDSLMRARQSIGRQAEEDVHILEKEGEAIWFIGDEVVKFSLDERFIANRVRRVEYLRPYVPEIVRSSRSMYVYKKVKGEIFSKNPKLSEFKYFLEWIEGFWGEPKVLDDSEKKRFRELCMDFYKDKTYKRVKEYFNRFEQIDIEEIVNNRPLPRLRDILDKVDWEYIADGIPSRFHGDLHFENILINDSSNRSFTLLDWRQDFGGDLLEYGDLYYDLAKLNHGLIICHELISGNLFSISRKLDRIEYDFYRKQSLVECEEYFRGYVIKKGYDWDKVRIITALIFLNIAPLHHYPYSLLLFYLGKTMLNDLVAS